MNPNLISRLYNNKFTQALQYAETEDEKELVGALSRMLGNVGWFEGDLSTIVEFALQALPGFGKDEEDTTS